MPMEEFDSESSQISNSSKEETRENLWMCGASRASMAMDSSEWCKDAMNNAYVPVPYPEEELEPMEWMHCLTTIDVCMINHGIKFCDEEGYDIIPIQMVATIKVVENDISHLTKERFHHKEVSIKDLFDAKNADGELSENEKLVKDDFDVQEFELEKI